MAQFSFANRSKEDIATNIAFYSHTHKFIAGNFLTNSRERKAEFEELLGTKTALFINISISDAETGGLFVFIYGCTKHMWLAFLFVENVIVAGNGPPKKENEGEDGREQIKRNKRETKSAKIRKQEAGLADEIDRFYPKFVVSVQFILNIIV